MSRLLKKFWWMRPLMRSVQILFPSTLRAESQKVRMIDRICASMFFVVFILSWSGLLTIVMGAWIIQTADVYRWQETPCRIIESEVLKPEYRRRHRFAVRYEYELDGRTYQGETYTHSYVDSYSDSEAEDLVQKYPAGGRMVCLVNPRDPSSAVLERESLWPAPLIVFPSIFVVIGVVGTYKTLRGAAGIRNDGPLEC